LARIAQGDITRAGRYLMALFQGDKSIEAEAGALLLADSLVSVRGAEHARGVQWPNGRPGL